MAYSDRKEYEGKSYSGMRVGGIHRWDYPDGKWHERKNDPSQWDFSFVSHKHRQGKAPEGSGAGEGSAYHWYIVAHQWAEKLDANRYATVMEGQKHLLGFRKPDWRSWNTQFQNQKTSRQRAIAVLEETLAALREEESLEMEDPWDLPVFKELAVADSPVAAEMVPADVLAR